MRAAPAVSCAKCTKESAHEHTGSAEAIRHSLRNGFTAYGALSPENRALLSPSPHGNRHVGPVGSFAPPRDLTPTAEASGPHAFAVRFSAVVLRAGYRSRVYARPAITCRADAIASTASHPTHVTIAIRPCGRVRRANLESDLLASQSEILPVGLICRRRDAVATCSPGKCGERRQSPGPVRRNPTCLRLLPVAAAGPTVRSQPAISSSRTIQRKLRAAWSSIRVAFEISGRNHEFSSPASDTLLGVLRDKLGYDGPVVVLPHARQPKSKSGNDRFGRIVLKKAFCRRCQKF